MGEIYAELQQQDDEPTEAEISWVNDRLAQGYTRKQVASRPFSGESAPIGASRLGVIYRIIRSRRFRGQQGLAVVHHSSRRKALVAELHAIFARLDKPEAQHAVFGAPVDKVAAKKMRYNSIDSAARRMLKQEVAKNVVKFLLGMGLEPGMLAPVRRRRVRP